MDIKINTSSDVTIRGNTLIFELSEELQAKRMMTQIRLKYGIEFINEFYKTEGLELVSHKQKDETQKEAFYNQAKRMVAGDLGMECRGTECTECFIALLDISVSCHDVVTEAKKYIKKMDSENQ